MASLNRETFITLLKEKYSQYYKTLISHNNLVLCVPAIEISQLTKHFIESHILEECMQSNRYTSYNGLIFHKTDNCLLGELNSNPNVEILSSYLVCEEYQSFKVYILSDSLVKIESEMSTNDIDNIKIKDQKDAIKFLKKYNKIGNRFMKDINQFTIKNLNAKELADEVQNMVKEKWSFLLHLQHDEFQQNSNFQSCLTVSLENVIAQNLYDKIMHVLHSEFECLDMTLFSKCKSLSKLDVTPDQLGIPKEFVTPLPAAIVELATLDTHRSPLEKLNCLQATYDLIVAELKGGIIEVLAEITDLEIPTITYEVIIILLMYVIIKSKPVHLISNCFFITNFQNTVTPESVLSSIIFIFQQAINKLKQFDIDDLNPRCTSLQPNIGLGDLIQITSEIQKRFDKDGRRVYKISSPSDLHLERLTSMIAAATLKNS